MLRGLYNTELSKDSNSTQSVKVWPLYLKKQANDLQNIGQHKSERADIRGFSL